MEFKFIETNVEEILKRVDLRQIVNFIMDEEYSSPEVPVLTYGERLKNGDSLILKRLRKMYGDDTAFDDALSDYTLAIAAYRDVFTEIGMKAGARLLYQLLFEEE